MIEAALAVGSLGVCVLSRILLLVCAPYKTTNKRCEGQPADPPLLKYSLSLHSSSCSRSAVVSNGYRRKNHEDPPEMTRCFCSSHRSLAVKLCPFSGVPYVELHTEISPRPHFQALSSSHAAFPWLWDRGTLSALREGGWSNGQRS